MSLKHFDLYFILSFILWVLYSAALYVAGKIKCNGNDNLIKMSCCGFIFGIFAAFLKTGMDSLIILIVGKTNNQILLTFVMEMEILLFGSMMVIVAFLILPKRKFAWDKTSNKVAAVLGCSVGIYAIAFLYFNSKFQSLAQYTDVNTLAENGNINLNTLMGMESIMRYSSTFTMLSMVISVVFFIGLWLMLERNSDEEKRK